PAHRLVILSGYTRWRRIGGAELAAHACRRARRASAPLPRVERQAVELGLGLKRTERHRDQLRGPPLVATSRAQRRLHARVLELADVVVDRTEASRRALGLDRRRIARQTAQARRQVVPV